MRQNGIRRFLMLAGTFVLASSLGQAATLVYNDSISMQTTNWSDFLTVQQFDPSLGTLNSINFELTGGVLGNIRIENQDASPVTATGNLTATVTLTRPDTTTLVVVIPLFSVSDNFGAYDGVADFDGPSGNAYLGVSGSDVENQTTSNPADLALFTGVGTISLPVSAIGASNATGGGNLLTSFSTQADAQLEITYNYTPFSETPEPATMGLMGTALAGAAIFIRRRK
jgi:hypothetical protein